MRKFFLFLSEIKRELFERTTWPTRDEVLNMTSFVVFSLIFVSIFLFGVDFFSNKLIHYVVVDEVAVFKNALIWTLEPILGIPWRFFGILFVVILVFYVIGKLRGRQS